MSNYAFIDGSNLHLCMQKYVRWDLDLKRFRTYLREKYHVEKAFYFIGYVKENQSLYTRLQEHGYILVFKPVLELKDQVKGNCDADLVLRAMIEYENYDKALVISSDGDFYSLVEHLYQTNKLEAVLSPDRNSCSELLRKKGKERMFFIEDLRAKLEYAKRKAPRKDGT